ncbi:MAG: type II toxin-antitoxin system VapC family toxin [Opitutaceae bacterium]
MAVPVYADTSFLVSLYVQDANSARAVSEAPRLLPAFLTPLIEHELRNAIRLCVFRRQITTMQREKALHDLESDMAAGVLHIAPLDWPKALKYAEALGRRHTEASGARGMDILHVASALALRAGRFVTFDERQREFARLAGLDTR